MSREIKFRAWDKTERKMREVLNINFIHKDVWLKLNEDKMIGANFFEIELMQYTGLKDKNGKEIYEGDIIKYYSEAINSLYGTNEILREVRFKYGMYGIEGVADNTHIPFANILESEYEVIGNIYENPELLEENNYESYRCFNNMRM